MFVRSAGFLTSVQDLGRTGYRQSGISVGGALDSHALRVANGLVGNEDAAAGLEATLGNLRLRFDDQRVVAWCGGAFSVRIGDENVRPGRAGLIAKDEELVMNAPKAGSRAWLAISGGVAVSPILGSRSTDLRGNFGGHEGRVLRDGDILPLGETLVAPGRVAKMFGDRRIAEWTAPSVWVTTAARARFLRIVRGPDWSRFTAEAQTSLVGAPFTVTLDSDRMAARLDGPSLPRHDAGDLLSEAVAPGTLQVPPNGKPILLLGDCQTIGGYPKIAHVITVDLAIAAQLWPGDLVRFHEVSLADAQELLREREEDFGRFRIGINLRSK
ncbi:MAG: biotin-dependent carboxyltransferase family protein [Gammaproteobacteria bacterium]